MAHDRGSQYRPELDGLRSIAVTLVVAFHCDLGVLPGGYIGVDVFFVLSGFLITGLLLRAATGGALSLVGFYARRARRLLPMALLVLVSISGVWLLVSNAVDRAPLVSDARSAALYLSNWHFASTATDYFASTDAPSPFVHYWSLSVEEQFYLCWPAIVVLVFSISHGRVRRARRLLATIATVLAVCSLAALAITTHEGASSYAYFGTDTRIYQLLGGALLAIWFQGRAARSPDAPQKPYAGSGVRFGLSALQIAAPVALIIIATDTVHLGSGLRGFWAVTCAMVLLWSLTLHPAGLGGRVLSLAPLVYIGQISYAMYLWHWPVILLIRRFVEISPGLLLIPAFVISLGLADLSQRVVEHPIRSSALLARHSRSTVYASLVASLVVAVAIAPSLLESTRRPAIQSTAGQALVSQQNPATSGAVTTGSAKPAPSTSAPKPTHTPVPPTKAILAAGQAHPTGGSGCLGKVGRACLAHRGKGNTVLVVGDSHLEAFLPVFVELAKKNDITLYTWMTYVCPWEEGALPTDAPGSDQSASCRAAHSDLYGTVLPQVKPDVTVVLNRGYDDPTLPRPIFDPANPSQQNPGIVLAGDMSSAVSSVLTHSRRLIVVEPWPSLAKNQRSCLASAQYDEQCLMSASSGKLPEEQAIESIARSHHDVGVVDLDRDVCPRFPACDAVVGGIVVRRDPDHLSIPFAASLTAALNGKLEAAGAFQRPRVS